VYAYATGEAKKFAHRAVSSSVRFVCVTALALAVSIVGAEAKKKPNPVEEPILDPPTASSGWSTSVLPDIRQRIEHVCFVPTIDIGRKPPLALTEANDPCELSDESASLAKPTRDTM
jgi:hypothetical protein